LHVIVSVALDVRDSPRRVLRIKLVASREWRRHASRRRDAVRRRRRISVGCIDEVKHARVAVTSRRAVRSQCARLVCGSVVNGLLRLTADTDADIK